MPEEEPVQWVDETYTADDEYEEEMAGLPYMYLWYATLHCSSEDDASTWKDQKEPDILRKAPISLPALLNIQKHIIWMAKSGDSYGELLGVGTDVNGQYVEQKPATDWPTSIEQAITKAVQQLHQAITSLQEQGADWHIGQIADPHAPGFDAPVKLFFDTWPACASRDPGAIYSVSFGDGTIMEILRPQTNGVLIYKIVEAGPLQRTRLRQGWQAKLALADAANNAFLAIEGYLK